MLYTIYVTVQPFHLFDVAMATYNKYIYIVFGVCGPLLTTKCQNIRVDGVHPVFGPAIACSKFSNTLIIELQFQFSYVVSEL